METPFALLVRGIHWWLVDYPHKWSVMWSSDVFVHCQSDEQLVESPLMWNCMMIIWLHWNHLHMIDILEIPTFTLLWCHNGHDGFSNHQPYHCLLNCLFSRRSKKTQISASLAFVWGIQRRPVNSPHKWPVTRKMFPFDDVIMITENVSYVITSNMIPIVVEGEVGLLNICVTYYFHRKKNRYSFIIFHDIYGYSKLVPEISADYIQRIKENGTSIFCNLKIVWDWIF